MFELKMTSNWRHIFNIPRTDFCVVKKIGDSIPFYSGLIEPKIKQYFGNMSLDCPLNPGRYYAMNIVENIYVEPTKKDKFEPPQYNPFDIPNGLYRCTIELSTNDDMNAFFLQWQFEQRLRTKDDKF